jgi:hypothetical protein
VEQALDRQEAGFASRVESLLKERNWTQGQLAEAAGQWEMAQSLLPANSRQWDMIEARLQGREVGGGAGGSEDGGFELFDESAPSRRCSSASGMPAWTAAVASGGIPGWYHPSAVEDVRVISRCADTLAFRFARFASANR